MSDPLPQAQAQLQQLHASGLLNDDAYRAALAALEAQPPPPKRRNVKARKIKGNVATGDHVRQVDAQTYIERQYTQALPPDPARLAGERYLDALSQRCNVLPLAALGGDDETGDEIRLEQVYIALDTRTRLPLTDVEKSQRQRAGGAALPHAQEDRPLTTLEAATQHRRLVLLGDPGSGKSTFVRQLVARLALVRRGLAELPLGWSSAPLPLLLVLHELAPSLAALDLEGLAAPEQQRRLTDAVRQQWLAQLAECQAGAFAPALEDSLRRGDMLLVFDGLDEVAESLRRRVRQAVRALCQSYPELRQVIITCRIRSYVGAAVFPDFASHTLAPFDALKIGQFIQAWYGAQVERQRLSKAKAHAAIADLQQAVRDAQLYELAANPMLLTTMAIIHQREIGLPRERVRLYHLGVQVLLSRWQLRKGGVVSPQLTALLKEDLKLRRILEQLAYRAHQQQAQGADQAFLTRGELLALLEDAAYLGDAGLAAEFLAYIDQRAGLLVGHGGGEGAGAGAASHPQTYSFPHRTFQEYLAGCQLVQGRSRAREYWRRTHEGDFWRLAAHLGAEELLYNRGNDAELVLDLAYDLCPAAPPREEHAWRALLWSGHIAHLLGAAAIRRDTAWPGGGAAYLGRLIPGLLGVLRHSPLKATERSDAGRLLALLGDPRQEVLDPLQLAFCTIPAGPFHMGRDDAAARQFEQPLHPCDLPYTYQISRYPITNAQFQPFVAASGYTNPAYWPEAIQHGRWHAGQVTGWTWDAQKEQAIKKSASAPHNYGEPFTLANYPVVGVSWYEALAFTRWLTEQLHARGALPADWVIRLPSEAEWEKAARGVDSRRYPWGQSADANRANVYETGIGHTSAVGAFPGGASPYGVEEMAGNVWEWTRSLWGEDYQKPDFGYPYDPTDGREELAAGDEVLRVLRGGSFYTEGGAVGCCVRFRNYWYYGYYSVGFRVVASPSTSGL